MDFPPLNWDLASQPHSAIFHQPTPTEHRANKMKHAGQSCFNKIVLSSTPQPKAALRCHAWLLLDTVTWSYWGSFASLSFLREFPFWVKFSQVHCQLFIPYPETAQHLLSSQQTQKHPSTACTALKTIRTQCLILAVSQSQASRPGFKAQSCDLR